jgi:purine-binding chemotaxis protein CheW
MHNELETGSGGHLIATFILGQSLFGVQAAHVQEVVRVGELTPVHHAPAYVVGIRNLRGRIVTVIDLAVRLGLGTVAPGADNRILIVESQNEPVGLLVDAVADTELVTDGNVLPPPPNINGVQSQNLTGVCRQGERLVALLELDAVLEIESRATSNARE